MGISLDTYLVQTKAQRAKYIKGFVAKQKHLKYPGYTEMVKRHRKGTVAEIETKWYMDPIDAGPGSIQGYGPFGRITNKRVDGVIELSVKVTTFVSHTNCIRDTFIEENFNKASSEGHIYNLKDSDEDKALKAFVEAMDRAVLDAPSNPGGTEGLTALNGALYYGALSQDANGVFVPQPTAARNGIYATMGDGSRTSVVLGADRSNIANECLRTPVATRGASKIDADDCERIARLMALVNYQYIEGLKGRTGAMPSHSIFMSWDDEQDYREMINQLAGDRFDDYFNIGNGQKIDRRMIHGSQNMPRQSIRPIIIVNHNELHLHTALWAQPRPWQRDENVVTNNQYYIAQMIAEDPSLAVAVMHGGW